MGGAVSVEHAEIIYVAEDGSIGLAEPFAARYENDMPFPIKRPVVTRQHEALIKANWSAICQGTSAFDAAKHLTPTKFFYRTFYNHLFELAPSLRPIFRSSMTVQGKALAGIIKTLATVINGANIVGATHGLAQGHLKYGAKKDHYTVVGQNLLRTLEIVSGDKWTEEIKTAYLTAYSLIYFVMLPVLLNNEPSEITESLPATISKSEAVSATAKRLTLTFDFPLRFHPGDAILLGLPVAEGQEERRHYTIASISIQGTNTFDIVVEDASPSSHWLVSQPAGTTVKLFWVESNVRFEIDSPEVLPTNVLFVSHGVGCVPFLVMLEGLYRIRETFHGSVVTLQVAPNQADVEGFKSVVTSTGKPLEWESSSFHYAPAVSADKLKDIAPNLAHSNLYVCGPADFIATTQDAFVAAGGSKDRITVYSFDNSNVGALKIE
ncbi:hypothetical protein H310_11316 [Aphanomyces invadans]|uniref:nitric oxide dioxygenase n=1 Tax=Aphanomyces invadans TaxID=157072 RepID=A0A024TNT1_9STRA|nr:hypothetical protein H310_11316 [Aphanomyces invadans]ETV94987.1 hypothetical protein H310_11316 [Aphanomyces invadans]RHY28672.1 hypothetical protein DYB32_005780 [Aphanomyces invadans]|eukprot:XP_008876160.1 hypothetical protein H310_11316 [Aphanomyces invadans]